MIASYLSGLKTSFTISDSGILLIDNVAIMLLTRIRSGLVNFGMLVYVSSFMK